MSQEYLLTLDLGSAHLRAARTLRDQSAALTPQLVEFGRQRALANVVCLSADGQTAEAVGDHVETLELAYDKPDRIYQELSFDADPASERGRAEEQLLSHVRRTALDDRTSISRTLFAVPAGTTKAACERLRLRLERVGFPAPQPMEAEGAALSWHTRGDVQPGCYLVIDCGASGTRAAVIEVAADGQQQVLSTDCGQPGGQDFDTAMSGLLSDRYPCLAVRDPAAKLELLHFSRSFKEGFSRHWAAGGAQYQEFCSLPSAREVVTLSTDEFMANETIGRYFAQIQMRVTIALQKAGRKQEEITAVILTGGGSQWPEFRRWLEGSFGSSRLLRRESPGESIVCGMAMLAGRPPVSAEQAGVSAVQPLSSLPAALAAKFVAATGAVSSAAGRLSWPKISLPKRAAAGMPQQAGPRTSVSMPVPRPVRPGSALAAELFGGLFGFLGLGWMIVLGQAPVGCLAMLGWWVLLGLAVLVSGGLAVFRGDTTLLLPLVPLWIGVPFISGLFAMRSARIRNRSLQVRVLDDSRSNPQGDS